MDNQSLYTWVTKDDNVLRITKIIKVNVSLLLSYHAEAYTTLVFPASYDINVGAKRGAIFSL